MLKRGLAAAPLPRDFLAWQVRLRARTVESGDGTPHVGVAPLVAVRASGVAPGVTVHSIICGLLPRLDLLDERTREFREVYESTADRGARAIHARGLEHLRHYYRSPDAFDATSLTTLIPRPSALAAALASDQRCALLFYVFDLAARSEEDRFRCLQLNCHAELHRDGPLYDNVWWHNALFHGPVDDHLMVRFRHLNTFDTRFGGLEPVDG